MSGRKGETPASDVGALKNRDLNQVSSPIMRIAPSTAPQWPERDAHIVSAGYDPLLTLANLQTSVIGSKAEADLLCLAAFGESVRLHAYLIHAENAAAPSRRRHFDQRRGEEFVQISPVCQTYR